MLNMWHLKNQQTLLATFRVNYDKMNWQMISQALLMDLNQIHRINRAQLLDDVLTLARTGHIDYQASQ